MPKVFPALFLLALAACATSKSDGYLYARLEVAGRVVVGGGGPLLLELADGLVVVVNLRAIDSGHLYAAFTILRHGQVVDEPDAVVEVGGDAEFDIDLGPVHPNMAVLQGPCPMSFSFMRWDRSSQVKGRLSIRAVGAPFW